jgi:predicted nucleic acid-binding Zn ribbon protein
MQTCSPKLGKISNSEKERENMNANKRKSQRYSTLCYFLTFFILFCFVLLRQRKRTNKKKITFDITQDPSKRITFVSFHIYKACYREWHKKNERIKDMTTYINSHYNIKFSSHNVCWEQEMGIRKKNEGLGPASLCPIHYLVEFHPFKIWFVIQSRKI